MCGSELVDMFFDLSFAFSISLTGEWALWNERSKKIALIKCGCRRETSETKIPCCSCWPRDTRLIKIYWSPPHSYKVWNIFLYEKNYSLEQQRKTERFIIKMHRSFSHKNVHNLNGRGSNKHELRCRYSLCHRWSDGEMNVRHRINVRVSYDRVQDPITEIVIFRDSEWFYVVFVGRETPAWSK